MHATLKSPELLAAACRSSWRWRKRSIAPAARTITSPTASALTCSPTRPSARRPIARRRSASSTTRRPPSRGRSCSCRTRRRPPPGSASSSASPACVEWSEAEVRALVAPEDKFARTLEIVRKISCRELMRFKVGLDGLKYRRLGPGDSAVGIVAERRDGRRSDRRTASTARSSRGRARPARRSAHLSSVASRSRRGVATSHGPSRARLPHRAACRSRDRTSCSTA